MSAAAVLPGRARRVPVLRALAILAGLLVALLFLEYHVAVRREGRALRPGPAASARAAAPARPRAALVPEAAEVDREVEVVLARPLFTQSRRPAAVAVSGPSEPRLAGIILGPNGGRAIFAGEGDNRGTVSAVGQTAGSWKILGINRDGVRVSGPSGIRVLKPSRGAGDSSGTASGAADQAPAHPSILDLLRARPAPFGAVPPPVPGR